MTRRHAFTLIELAVVIVILGLLAVLAIMAVQRAREAARRSTCAARLNQVGKALIQFHDNHSTLPAGWITTRPMTPSGPDPEGEPGWGWASMILPYLEEQELYDQIYPIAEITSEYNQGPRTTPVRTYLCPTDPAELVFEILKDYGPVVAGEDPPKQKVICRLARSNYVGMYGPTPVPVSPSQAEGCFYHNSHVGFNQIADGLSTTILVGERASASGLSTWVGMVDGAEFAMQRVVGSSQIPPNRFDQQFGGFSSFHPTGANFLFADGSIDFLTADIDPTIYRALSTRSAGEVARR